MRAILLTAIAAVILSPPALCERAGAMTLGGTLAQRAAAADIAFVRQAVVVCGSNGCGRVHTSRVPAHRPRP
jgi:hypothetical protein